MLIFLEMKFPKSMSKRGRHFMILTKTPVPFPEEGRHFLQQLSPCPWGVHVSEIRRVLDEAHQKGGDVQVPRVSRILLRCRPEEGRLDLPVAEGPAR